MNAAEAKTYPASRHSGQTLTCIVLLLERGSLTHTECEELTEGQPCGKVRTLRSRIPEIRVKWGWPVESKPESHGTGTHARYWVKWDVVEERTGLSGDLLKRTIWLWRTSGGKTEAFGDFVAFCKQHRPKDPASDRMARAIFKSKKMVKPADVQLDLGDAWMMR